MVDQVTRGEAAGSHLNKPFRVVTHNTVSLDGAVTGFSPDIRLHYEIASSYRPDLMLVGSRTARMGIEMFSEEVPVEEETDLSPSDIDVGDSSPYWVIPDTRGILHGLLHVYRKSGYCKDVSVLVSRATPPSYLSYLDERRYEYFMAGEDHVDYREAFAQLNERYGPELLLTDSGGTLNSILMRQGFVDEVSVLVAPVLVGDQGIKLFRDRGAPNDGSGRSLELIKNDTIGSDYVWLVYKVVG